MQKLNENENGSMEELKRCTALYLWWVNKDTTFLENIGVLLQPSASNIPFKVAVSWSVTR